MRQKIFCALILSALFSAHAYAMQAELTRDQAQNLQQDGQPVEQAAAVQTQGQLGVAQEAVIARDDAVLDELEEFFQEDEIYGDEVISERTGITRFINDILDGCIKKWDEQKFLDAVQEHIDDGVRINKSCRQRITPLMYACWFEAPLRVIQALRAAGGSVRRCRDREGRTALRYACQPKFPRYDVIKLLLDTGARASAADDDGGVPVDYVWRNPHADQRVKDLLLERYKAELQNDERVRIQLQKKDEERRARRARVTGRTPKTLEEKEVDSPEILIRRLD